MKNNILNFAKLLVWCLEFSYKFYRSGRPADRQLGGDLGGVTGPGRGRRRGPDQAARPHGIRAAEAGRGLAHVVTCAAASRT